MDKWIIIHPTHLLPNPFMTQPAHLPPLVIPFGFDFVRVSNRNLPFGFDYPMQLVSFF